VKNLRTLARRWTGHVLPYNLGDQQGSAWEARAQQACRLLRETAGDALTPPVRIADIGCGNQRLRGGLETEFGKTGIVYQGFDIQPQAGDVVAFDVRHAAPPGEWDVLVTLGVLEYIEDQATTLQRLAAAGPWFVVSHVVADGRPAAGIDQERYGWTRLPWASELSQDLVRAGFSIGGHQLLDGGRTGLWVCHSNRAGRTAAGSSAPDDM
jgi:hypothetical protein